MLIFNATVCDTDVEGIDPLHKTSIHNRLWTFTSLVTIPIFRSVNKSRNSFSPVLGWHLFNEMVGRYRYQLHFFRRKLIISQQALSPQESLI